MTRVLDPVWIPMADGCRLAARIWLPDDATRRPCPAILEAIPYRRLDGTLTIDHPRFDWWAKRGFAGVRLDIRGSGDSDGLLHDEYLPQEQDDACEALSWLAAQAWCNGRIGMIGYSWGGFAGLQVAARRPPELRAVVTVNSTVRRYTDDCHYIGGSVNAHDMLSWATTMLAFDARPPDPETVGARWREMWERRLEVAPPMIERWLSHQLEDDYWRHGSVAFAWDAIRCPVLAVGGWGDPYRNAVLELLTGLTAPSFGLIGPWAHGYPHATDPGPQIAFLSECARFFRRYMEDEDNGYDDEPALRCYVQDFDSPRAHQTRRTGHWIALGRWPPVDSADARLALGRGSLRRDEAPQPSGQPATREPLRISGVQTNGLAAGSWCPYGGPTQPRDQRGDDALSLCFDSEPLQEELTILGFPRLHLRVMADQQRALVVARLCDVAPGGESLLVTRGVLNLTHRDGHDTASAVPPGQPLDVELRLDSAGHRFERGHRVRLAVSPTYWPWVWPSPTPVTLSVDNERSWLSLPLLGAHASTDLGAAEPTEPVAERWLARAPFAQTIRRDLVDGVVELTSQPDFLAGRRQIPDLGLETEDWGENVYRIEEHDPLSATVVCRRRAALARPGWDVRVEADATMRCTADHFAVETELRAFAGGRGVATRRFRTEVRRHD